MFQRVRETLSDYAATAKMPKPITRRRVKASFSAAQHTTTNHHHQNQRSSSIGRRTRNENHHHQQHSRNKKKNDDDSDDDDHHENADDDDEDEEDNRSVQSTITVETTRTASNENRKPTGVADRGAPTQILIEPPSTPGDLYNDPVEVLERAQSDITKLSIYIKEIAITRHVASAFFGLVRGDNRSWEAIAVDILRQKARWDNITLEDCEGEYLDTVLGFLWNMDNCAFLHLSNLLLTPNAAWTMQSLQFCKSMTKLQFDLIDLSFAMPLLCQGLKQNLSLSCLIASRCGLNDDRLHELFTCLPKQLVELRIFGNRCREKGLAAITAVVHHSQHLKILDLSYQHVDPSNRSMDGEFDVSWLAGALHHNRVLKVLDLDNDGIDDGHLTHICAALCANDTLEEVMLNHNRITATGIALLSHKFGEMKGLKKISMYSNLFDAPQVDAMVAQNKQPMPRQISNVAEGGEGEADEEVTSDLEDENETENNDDDDDDDFDYEEEIVGEDDHDDEEEEEEVAGDDGSSSGEGEFMDDDSSAPPPSADFREPEEIDNDSIPDDDEDGDGEEEQEQEQEKDEIENAEDREEDATEEEDDSSSAVPPTTDSITEDPPTPHVEEPTDKPPLPEDDSVNDNEESEISQQEGEVVEEAQPTLNEDESSSELTHLHDHGDIVGDGEEAEASPSTSPTVDATSEESAAVSQQQQQQGEEGEEKTKEPTGVERLDESSSAPPSPSPN